MFINKDAKSDSLSHSHKSERIQIHSHVQKGRRYKKSDGGIVYATHLPDLRPGRRLATPDDTEDDSDRKSDHPCENSTSQEHKFVQYQPQTLVSAGGHEYFANQDPNIDPLLWDYSELPILPTASPPSIPTFPASAEENFDPFEATCVKVDQAIYSLLQYFLRVVHPNVWHLERAVRPDHAYTFRYNAMEIVQGSLHDEYNMYALLAYMSNYMDNIEGVSPPGNPTFYIHKALRASQKYVKSRKPLTARVIFNVFCMGCAEWYRYNREGACVHLSAAKSMIDSMGGLKKFDGPLVELLLTGDAYVAGELQRKPLWEESDFDDVDNHPMTAYGLHELQKLLSGTVPIGSGLLKSSRKPIIPAELRWVILDLAVVLSLLRSSQSADKTDESQHSQGLHWVYTRSLTIRHRLLHIELEDARSDAVRVAMVMWMFMCFTITGRRRTVKVVAPLLRDALLQIPDEEWHDHEEVHLWVLTIGALAATLATEEHTWFVNQISLSSALREVATEEADRIFAALLAISDRFFYHEPAQKYNLRALADDLAHERTTRENSTASATSNSPR